MTIKILNNSIILVSMYWRFLNIIFLFFLIKPCLSQKTFSQSRNEKKLSKYILKLNNPKWLKINNNKAYFKYNISSSLSRVSSTSNDQVGRLNNGQSKTQKFLYNKSGYDYDKLEKRIIQVAVFKPRVKILEIDLIANCRGNAINSYDKLNNSQSSFQGLSSLYIDENQLNHLRKINTQSNFIKNNTVSDQIIMDNISRSINQICK